MDLNYQKLLEYLDEQLEIKDRVQFHCRLTTVVIHFNPPQARPNGLIVEDSGIEDFLTRGIKQHIFESIISQLPFKRRCWL